jgi:HK97 gp10 family phage protein
MDFSVQIDGLDALANASQQVRDAVADEINKAVYASAQQVVLEAKKSILSGGKSGRLYHRRTVTHQASAPGEAPASDTGRLVNSLSATLTNPGEATASAGNSNVKYAAMLEFGTTNIAPRPFFFVAFEKSKAWIGNRIGEALQRGIARAAK